MKTKAITFILFMFLLPLPKLQAGNYYPSSGYDFQWKQVDSLTNAGLPKSALNIVDNIYQLAKIEKNDPMIIKAIIYRIRLSADFQENFLPNAIRYLSGEIADSREPVVQILHSILGEVYWKYYQNNQYRFHNRTRILNVIPDSIETWDLTTLASHIIMEYRQSLSNQFMLQDIPVNHFHAILDKPVFESNKTDQSDILRPTLFDFLAHRALNFFTTFSGLPFQSVNSFQLDNPVFFEQTPKFINYPLQTRVIHAKHADNLYVPSGSDSLSLSWYAIRIFQNLATFHFNDKNPGALIYAELERFQYVFDQAVIPDKDSLYLNALTQFEKDYLYSPFSTEISFTLANKLYEQGLQYYPLISEQYKWDIKQAFSVCEQALLRFPESEGSLRCKNLITAIRSSALQITSESAVIPDQHSAVQVNYKNIPTLFLRLLNTNPEEYEQTINNLNREQLFIWLTSRIPSFSWTIRLPSDGDYQSHKTEIPIRPLKAGYYILVASEDSTFKDASKTFTYLSFWSTHISYVYQKNDAGGIEIYLLDRESGKPMKNLFVEAYTKSYNYQTREWETIKKGTFSSDQEGFFVIPPIETKHTYANLYLKIQDNNDLLITSRLYQYPAVSSHPSKPILETRFFTDRAIYRPGQPIYFKGIILERRGDDYMLKTNQKTQVVFTDVNGQKISDGEFTTNEYGSFHGSFTAPPGVLTGQMNIFNESGSKAISVEEYKRPTFEVTFQPLEGNYRLGEIIRLEGHAKAYSSAGIDQGIVNYRVIRTARFPYWDRGGFWPWPVSPEIEITNGSGTTYPDGTFIINFIPIPDLKIPEHIKPVFTYTVFVEITDINGETQSASEQISVGYTSILLKTNIPEKINLEKDSIFFIRTTNLNGRSTPADVTISIKKILPPERLLRSRSWRLSDIHSLSREEWYRLFPNDSYADDANPLNWAVKSVVLEKIINTKRDTVCYFKDNVNSPLSPGNYLIVTSVKDPFGESIVNTHFCTVYSPESKEIPIKTLDWFVPLKTEGKPGETASFLIGSSEEIQIIYEIRVKDMLKSRKWLKIKNEQIRVDIPVLEEYRGNFSVNFLFVKMNRVFQHVQLITVPYPDKSLDIALASFRSDLIPGASEEWKITITNAVNKGVFAEFLTTMYDASLDIFRSNNWTFHLYKRFYSTNPWEARDGFQALTSRNYAAIGINYNPIEPRSFDQLNWFGLHYFGSIASFGRFYKGAAETDELSMKATPMMGQTMQTSLESAEQTSISDSAQINKPSEIKQIKYPGLISLRKDFRETAFFYPSLLTDSSGNLILKFIVPDALTSWKLLGLAYTKQLDYGLMEQELITRKELMVFPNAPRFIRQGDTLEFTTKIVNLSGRQLTGEITLDLFDGIDSRPLNTFILNSEKTIPFHIEKDLSSSVTWTLQIPVDPSLGLLQYRIVAKSGTISDGEERNIPVLSNRMLVTESFPLPVRGNGRFGFTFEKLLQSHQTNHTRSNYRLTLEFSPNPAWYAIQALPSLSDVHYRNADQVFASYYANSIASFIANSDPKIQQVFESWKTHTPDALTSNLEKNEQLKTALLQETPWVLEAKNETDNKQKLGQFFDRNNIENKLTENLNYLIRMQTANGAWPWFSGMPESRYITLNIITGLGHLDRLGVKNIREDQRIMDMIQRAIRYLDGELEKDYNQLKKNYPQKLDNNHISPLQVKSLYARTYFLQDQPLQTTEAFRYFQNQAEKYWLQQTFFQQGMIALMLHRLGNDKTPVQILKSLSEKAIHSEEMGMYWSFSSGYDWFQAPVETQSLLIEAYDEITHDLSAIEEMKIWLLKQKQTQMWKTSSATVEALYALLIRGANLLADDPQVTITVGDQTIDPVSLRDTKQESGSGYFQVSWSGEEIVPDMGRIKINKSSEGIAWGALYWQYFEDIDQITAHQTPLKIERALFLEKNTGSGPVLVQITKDKNPNIMTGDSPNTSISPSHYLKIGDKLKVRLIVTVDRNMEFVHVKDMRAAGLEPSYTYPNSFRTEGDGLSGYRYQDGLGYYQSAEDIAMNFFFDYLPKGTYVFEYPLVVNNAGDFSTGIATIQCMYAPEFSAHSEGSRIEVSR